MPIVSLQPFAIAAIPVCHVRERICRYAKCSTLAVELIFQHFYNLLSSQNVLATKCNSKPQKNKFTHFESRCTCTPSFHVEKHQNEVHEFHTPFFTYRPQITETSMFTIFRAILLGGTSSLSSFQADIRALNEP